MQLTYRGTLYTSNPQSIETQDTGHLAHFLGKPYPMRRPIQSKFSQAKVGLKFRGIQYISE
jgi:hypothetical protein